MSESKRIATEELADATLTSALPLGESERAALEARDAVAAHPEPTALLQYLRPMDTDSSLPRSGLTAMRLVGVVRSAEGRRASVTRRGPTTRGNVQQESAREVEVADEVEDALLDRALAEHQFVLVEFEAGQAACVIGMIQTKLPSQAELRGEEITIEGARSVTLTSGRAGLKLHADGNVEIVGTRVSAVSRGLMRLVGRALRLN